MRGVGCASCYSSAHISSGHGVEGGGRRIDITVAPYAATQSDYTPSDSCTQPPPSSAQGLVGGWCCGEEIR